MIQKRKQCQKGQLFYVLISFFSPADRADLRRTCIVFICVHLRYLRDTKAITLALKTPYICRLIGHLYSKKKEAVL